MATVEHGSKHSGGADGLPFLASEPVGFPLERPSPASRRIVIFQAIPAWMMSMILHVLILLILALVTVSDPQQVAQVITAQSVMQPVPELDTVKIDVIDDRQFEPTETFNEPVVTTSEPLESLEPVELDTPLDSLSVPIDVLDMMAEMAPASDTLQTLGAATPEGLRSRDSEMKKQLLLTYGGTEASEAAVTRALEWIKRHQMPNGGWTFAHQTVCRQPRCTGSGDISRARAFNGATALALLPFLGAGQTHMAGSHRETVGRGLLFLIRNGRQGTQDGVPVLDLTEPGGTLYSHGLAAIVLCEAYAMSQDPALAAPAQGALNFIAFAQNPRDGGWRYLPQHPSGGDTSVTGWQVMALKSGSMAHLTIPPATVRKASLFLDKVQSPDGSMYGYRSPPRDSSGHLPCHPIGLLCRMYLGWGKHHPSIQRGVANLAQLGVQTDDIYYNYYAAQVLRHYGGAVWEQYNLQMRDWLLAQQVPSGPAGGSWHWPDSRSHRGPGEGGRLCSTALATMILEVYYRHMPLYAEAAADEDFPL